ncbi:endolysin [Flavobacterium phage vB_FspS_hemulen6-1]|uniref:Peptidase n=2 Tax=Lillamyvirus hemulen TaxID=2844288 RepID=A0A6B9LGB2_9CAUD|nr:endolysin [Flavobacterium phage vB_FspS_hemulen6-1]QHB38831.1 peptidase [Flavobacterium phage vB_FspS_hemulen6-1]QHB38901.1 peptidase [Flavobacterium phage vB_FspS_hemulen6-2]QHB38971.1 peptidase [Flavobacterium phage vB_FspS_hemulen9-1]
MAKITTNFSLEEFKCKDGSDIPNDVLKNIIELANNLQVLRDYLGVSITITSGYRSPKYNAKIGGVKNSQHPKGKAGDLKTKEFTPKQVAEAIEKLIKEGKMKQGGIGIYPNFTHYDIRGIKARW